GPPDWHSSNRSGAGASSGGAARVVDDSREPRSTIQNRRTGKPPNMNHPSTAVRSMKRSRIELLMQPRPFAVARWSSPCHRGHKKLIRRDRRDIDRRPQLDWPHALLVLRSERRVRVGMLRVGTVTRAI